MSRSFLLTGWRFLVEAAALILMAWSCVIATTAAAQASEDQYLRADFTSDLLSAFWKQPVEINAHILLPDSYYKEPNRRYPTVYVIPALDATSDLSVAKELEWQKPMRANAVEFIIVVLEPNFNHVHTFFADSANNGPWATAMVREFVPFIDAKLRTIPSPSSRFLEGHSSGGWAALWLQVAQPALFGGVWAVSPDPVDFTDYCGVDLVATQANMFHDGAGHAYWLERSSPFGASMRDLTSRLPEQFHSDDAAFSPRGSDGKPEQLFDWRTGAIDPRVATYWEEHYDVDRLVSREGPQQATNLRGKIHVYVGDKDTFHLEGSVHLLDLELKQLGAAAEIVYVPGADHWSVFDYDGGLLGRMTREMKQALPTAETASTPG